MLCYAQSVRELRSKNWSRCSSIFENEMSIPRTETHLFVRPSEVGS